MSTTKIAATMTGIDRLGNSPDGNPKYNVHTDKGTYATKADASINYVLSARPVNDDIHEYVVITLENNRIVNIQPA